MVVVGALSSGINAVAGGGSLVSFPVLTVGFGIPSLIANATNSVALWPGSLSGALGLLNALKQTGRFFMLFLPSTIIGSLIGSHLLVRTTHKSFDRIVPWLILVAALILVLQPKIKAFAEAKGHRVSPAMGVVVQFLVAMYGGYFGAGMGIMMLGAFALTIEGDIHELNAVKNWLGVVINLVASIYFFAVGLVLLKVALAMTVGSLIGGYLAAKASQKLRSEHLRLAIATYGVLMSAYFFYRSVYG